MAGEEEPPKTLRHLEDPREKQSLPKNLLFLPPAKSEMTHTPPASPLKFQIVGESDPRFTLLGSESSEKDILEVF